MWKRVKKDFNKKLEERLSKHETYGLKEWFFDYGLAFMLILGIIGFFLFFGFI